MDFDGGVGTNIQKIPNSKFQIPNKYKILNTKYQIPNRNQLSEIRKQ